MLVDSPNTNEKITWEASSQSTFYCKTKTRDGKYKRTVDLKGFETWH